jgi:hypothetical protein
MNGKVPYLRVLVGFLVLLMAAPPWSLAQDTATGASFKQEELDQMFAPIALYPDSLLGQILVAATYPDQVTEADQWVKQNSRLQGDDLNAAVDAQNWDLSVKALVPFPQVLSMMTDKMDWTRRMGDAFLAGQDAVMDSIQRLRAKAHDQGNLNDTEQQKVVVRGESIEIVPVNPRVVYVPAYNPLVIYGPWWYPGYLPYAYSPYYPGYLYDPYYTGAGFITAGLFGFAAGIAVGSYWNSGWGRWDWGRRDVYINLNRSVNLNRNDIARRDMRTTSFRGANIQRGSRGTVGTTAGQLGSTRTSGKTAVQTGSRPSAASVQQGLRQRANNAQVRQGRTSGQRGQATMGSTSGQTGRSSVKSTGKSGSTMSSERSKGQRGSAMSSGRSTVQRGSAMSSGRSTGQRGSAMSSGKSQGNSVRSSGSSGGGGGARGSGGSHGKQE